MFNISKEKMGIYWPLCGILIALIGCLSNAFAATILKQTNTLIPSLSVVFYTTLFTTIFFLLTQKWASFFRAVAQNKRKVCWLNITTLISWLTGFYSLLFISPALSVAILCGIQPLCVLMLNKRTLCQNIGSYPHFDTLLILSIIAVLSTIIITYLVFETHHHHYAGLTACPCLLGVGLSICSGFISACNMVLVKEFSNKSVSSSSIMAFRFWALIVISFIGMFYTNCSFIINYQQITPIISITLLYSIIPLFALQKAIAITDPATVSLIVPLQPLFTYLFEFSNAENHMLPPSLLLLMLIMTILIFLGIFKRRRPTLT